MNAELIVMARNQILNNIISFFKQKKGVLALFLSGSIAENKSDEYSDIDFRVIVEDKYYNNFINSKFDVPKIWGDFLFNNPSHPKSNYCVSHFKPFVKVDVFYYRRTDIQPSPWHKKGILVVHDPKDIMKQLIKDSEQLHFEYTPKEINNSINSCFSCAHEVYRRANRGEILYAIDLLNSVRKKIVEADNYLSRQSLQGFSHYEMRGNHSLVSALRTSLSASDSGSILYSLKELMILYKDILYKLQLEYNLQREKAKDEYCIDIVCRN
jgi:predicted nucleotidyltransferase